MDFNSGNIKFEVIVLYIRAMVFSGRVYISLTLRVLHVIVLREKQISDVLKKFLFAEKSYFVIYPYCGV
jgi:hypothetical protein